MTSEVEGHGLPVGGLWSFKRGVGDVLRGSFCHCVLGVGWSLVEVVFKVGGGVFDVVDGGSVTVVVGGTFNAIV